MKSSPAAGARFFSHSMATLLAPLGHTANVWIGPCPAAPHRRDAGLLADRAASGTCIGLAPLSVTFQTAAQCAGSAAADGVEGHLHRLRGSAEDAVFGREKSRISPGRVPRLSHLYRVRPLPVAVPGLEHRQAVVPLLMMDLRDILFAKTPIFGEGHDRRRPLDQEGGLERSRRHHVPGPVWCPLTPPQASPSTGGDIRRSRCDRPGRAGRAPRAAHASSSAR